MNEAELLFSEILSCGYHALHARRMQPLGPAASSAIAAVLKRRISGEPLQYILGRAEFMGMEFKLTPDALIPRPETELLVEKVVELGSRLQAPGRRLKICEVGTGSGCIAVSLAKLLGAVEVTATDISAVALKLAQANAKLHQVEDKIVFSCSDLFAIDYRLSTIGYDFIISNPPYIRSRDIDSLQPEIQYEPRIALDGGEDGLNFYRALAIFARQQLKEGGYLFLEIGFGQRAAVCRLLTGAGLSVEEVVNDYNGMERIIIAHPQFRTGF